jgi:uncharacterized zinc-type alcohol dehydrogenase-like protein
LSGSTLGSPATMATMLEFCVRHDLGPLIETFPTSRVNDALDHLRSGKARYRLVLRNDFSRATRRSCNIQAGLRIFCFE